MKSHSVLLQIHLNLSEFKFDLLGFLTAFVASFIMIPFLIRILKRFSIYDIPALRKEHSLPVPTMGGVAIVTGLLISAFLWLPFFHEASQTCLFFSVVSLCFLGMLDDIKDLSARSKLLVQTALAVMIAVSGTRIHSLNGLFGIHDLPASAQYVFTILIIIGVTNAFNLIDGVDGLAGSIGFMSLITIGIFLSWAGESIMAMIAFAFAGGLLAFLYFNLNPAKIFMGDTGSLTLGFVIATLGIRLMQINVSSLPKVSSYAPVFILGLVLIPVFDAIRVFCIRIWKGRSPFDADKTHLHHLLRKAGCSHSFITKFICLIHALILCETYWLREWRQEWLLALLITQMIVVTWFCQNILMLFNRTNPVYSFFEKRKMELLSDTEYSEPHL